MQRIEHARHIFSCPGTIMFSRLSLMNTSIHLVTGNGINPSTFIAGKGIKINVISMGEGINPHKTFA